MTQEEKFNIFSIYLKKIIEENVDVDIFNEFNGEYCGIIEYDTDDKSMELFNVRHNSGRLILRYKNGGYLNIAPTKEQMITFYYLFGQIKELAEEKVISSVLAFSE